MLLCSRESSEQDRATSFSKFTRALTFIFSKGMDMADSFDSQWIHNQTSTLTTCIADVHSTNPMWTFNASEAAPREHRAGRSPQPKRPVHIQQLDSLVSDTLVRIRRPKPPSKKTSVCMPGPSMATMNRVSAKSPLRLAVLYIEDHAVLHLECEILPHGEQTIEHWSDTHGTGSAGCMLPFEKAHQTLIRPSYCSSNTCRANNPSAPRLLQLQCRLSTTTFIIRSFAQDTSNLKPPFINHVVPCHLSFLRRPRQNKLRSLPLLPKRPNRSHHPHCRSRRLRRSR